MSDNMSTTLIVLAIIAAIVILSVLYAGDPDLMDAIIKNMGACK